VVVVHTLDRLGRTVRDTLNLIHDLGERGVGVRNLANPIRVDSANPSDPMAQLALALLTLFGQMEGTYTLEERRIEAPPVEGLSLGQGAAASRRWNCRPRDGVSIAEARTFVHPLTPFPRTGWDAESATPAIDQELTERWVEVRSLAAAVPTQLIHRDGLT